MKHFRTFLVYDRPRLARNGWLVRTLTEKFAKHGLKLELKLAEEALREDAWKEDLPDAVVMRCAFPELSRRWEAAGVRVFNSSEVSETANDKLKTFKRFSEIVPMMETRALEAEWEEEGGEERGRKPVFRNLLPFPFVLKSRNGHGGTEVFCVREESELRSRLEQSGDLTPERCQRWLIQELAEAGRDVRVYVLGNRIFAGMERFSEKDFRSNYSLGGQARPHALTVGELALVRQVLSTLEFDFAGIDLIFDRGRAVLNEIEDVVGSRMLYANTKLDVLEAFTTHVLSVMAAR